MKTTPLNAILIFGLSVLTVVVNAGCDPSTSVDCGGMNPSVSDKSAVLGMAQYVCEALAGPSAPDSERTYTIDLKDGGCMRYSVVKTNRDANAQLSIQGCTDGFKDIINKCGNASGGPYRKKDGGNTWDYSTYYSPSSCTNPSVVLENLVKIQQFNGALNLQNGS